MAKKPRKLTKKQIAEQRAAMDRVLTAALAECTDMLRIIDFANWLRYACVRDDARATAWDMLQSEDLEERREAHKHTVKDEMLDAEDAAYDDGADAMIEDLRDVAALGARLDPGFNKPILEHPDWLAPKDPGRAAMREQHQRIVDNAIDSKRRTGKRR